MDTNYIYDIYQKNSLNLDALKCYYNFSGVSGDFVKNNLFKIEEQIIISPTQKLINNLFYPGLFVNRQYNYSTTTGSGIFLNSDALKIIGNIHNSFNLLIDFDAVCNNFITGKQNILVYLENTGNSNIKYNFLVGLNNSSNIFGLFSGYYSGKTEIKTCQIEPKINKKNIISINFNETYASITKYKIQDLFDQNTFLTGSGAYDTANIYFDNTYRPPNDLSNLYIGGFPRGYINSYATGYSGYINNILYSSGLISEKINNDIAYSHFKTGSLTINQTVPQVSVYKYSGSFLNPTGIISSGITGYSYIPSGVNISYNLSSPYYVLYASGVSGNITGYKIEYQSSIASGISYQDIVSYKDLYDKNLIQNYTGSCYTIKDSIYSYNNLIYNNDEPRFGVN